MSVSLNVNCDLIPSRINELKHAMENSLQKLNSRIEAIKEQMTVAKGKLESSDINASELKEKFQEVVSGLKHDRKWLKFFVAVAITTSIALGVIAASAALIGLFGCVGLPLILTFFAPALAPLAALGITLGVAFGGIGAFAIFLYSCAGVGVLASKIFDKMDEKKRFIKSENIEETWKRIGLAPEVIAKNNRNELVEISKLYNEAMKYEKAVENLLSSFEKSSDYSQQSIEKDIQTIEKVAAEYAKKIDKINEIKKNLK